MQKSELLKQLSERAVTVTFAKKDGSDRVMLCTRSPSIIPLDHHPKGETQVVTEETDNIKVFDIESLGWRSFNMSSIKSSI
jgi:hypothetical protein